MFVESVMGLLQGNYISRGGMTQGLHVTRVRQSLYQPHSVIFFPFVGSLYSNRGIETVWKAPCALQELLWSIKEALMMNGCLSSTSLRTRKITLAPRELSQRLPR